MKNEIIREVYLSVVDLFPKKCGCGRVYKNEKEYLQRTDNCGIMESADPGYLFLRNCKCHSTLSVVIDEQTHKKIIKNIEKISQQENCSIEQTISDFYSSYKEWVRKHEKISTNRVLIYDGVDSEETKKIFIPHVEVVRSTSLEEALDSFQANPEWTKAILLKSSGDYSKDLRFLSLVKNHRNYDENIAMMGIIEQTVNEKDAPNFDCLTRRHLTQDQLTRFLTTYLRNVIQVI